LSWQRRFLRSVGRLAGLLLLAVSLPASVAHGGPTVASDPRGLVEDYLARLQGGDPGGADSLWVADDLRHANRLGIRYPAGPPKHDSASIIFPNLAAIQRREVRVSVARVEQEENQAEITLELTGPAGPGGCSYRAEKVAGVWKLASSLRLLTRGWACRDTRYFRLLAPEPSWWNDRLCHALTAEVNRQAAVLGVTEDRLLLLEREKFDLVFCKEAEVERLAGAPTRGFANLQFDAVVTQERFHTHEMAHLMVNFWLQELPLFTLPFFQEGTAVHLGGRWGKSPAVMEMLGVFLLENWDLDLADLLDFQGFHRVMADLSYPVAGLFCGFLLERVGAERYRRLYLAASGTAEEVQGLEPDRIKSLLQEITGTPWSELMADFDRWWPRRRDGGLRPLAELPGEVAMKDSSGTGVVRVGCGGERTWFEVELVPGANRGVVLLRESEPEFSPPSRSNLFADRLPGEAYRGERAGIIFDAEAQEVGLYDFALDLLVAKFAVGLGGKDSLWDEQERRLRLELDFNLLPDPCRLIEFELRQLP